MDCRASLAMTAPFRRRAAQLRHREAQLRHREAAGRGDPWAQANRHSRAGGNPLTRQGWIPAFAGMTGKGHRLRHREARHRHREAEGRGDPRALDCRASLAMTGRVDCRASVIARSECDAAIAMTAAATHAGDHEENLMPEISRFFGIVIAMFYSEHNPPHFHARYGEHKVEVDIQTLSVLAGKLPPRAMGLVIDWASRHQEELMADWALARQAAELKRIEPLE